jgi:hypothetical protein
MPHKPRHNIGGIGVRLPVNRDELYLGPVLKMVPNYLIDEGW